MQQPASTTVNPSSRLSWQTRNSPGIPADIRNLEQNLFHDGNENSDGDFHDVEPSDVSEAISRLIHEANNGISMNPSPDTSNTNSCSSPTATEPNDHSTASEGTDVIVHEGFENNAVGSTPFALGNHNNESNPAELCLAKQIIKLKQDIATLKSRVEQLEQDNASFVERLQHRPSEVTILNTKVDQLQRELQQLEQISAELILDKVESDLLNKELYERMKTLERGHQLAQEKTAELQAELDKGNEENMRQKDEIEIFTSRYKELEKSAERLYERIETLEREHQLAQEKSAELQAELDKRNEENMSLIDTTNHLTKRLTESEESAKMLYERMKTFEGDHQLALEKAAELHAELDKRNGENMRLIDTTKQFTLKLYESIKKRLEKIRKHESLMGLILGLPLSIVLSYNKHHKEITETACPIQVSESQTLPWHASSSFTPGGIIIISLLLYYILLIFAVLLFPIAFTWIRMRPVNKLRVKSSSISSPIA